MPSNKPTTLLSLPPELLIPILALASPTSSDPTGSTRYSLSQLRLTCRALYDLSTSLFWEDVNVPGEYGEGRGKAGHAEAMGRLLMIREAREGVRRMLFRIPDGSYLLSAALLGSFRNLSNLSIVFIRPETREVAISRSITQGLVDLPHLSSLTLSGFTGIEDPSFRLSSLRLSSLALVNCQHLDSLLGSSPFVKSLELVADASDRPIDTVLSPEQWDSLERLELEGTVLADFFNVPGLLPPYLISSLRDHPHPPQIRTLDLRYFSAAPSDGMQVLTRLRPEKLQLRTSSGKLFSELESWPKALWAHTTDAILAPVDWPDLLLVVEHVVRCFPALERLDLVADSEGPAHGVGLLLRELAGVLSASRVRKIKLVVGYRAEWYCLSRSPGEDAFAGVGVSSLLTEAQRDMLTMCCAGCDEDD